MHSSRNGPEKIPPCASFYRYGYYDVPGGRLSGDNDYWISPFYLEKAALSDCRVLNGGALIGVGATASAVGMADT